MDQEMVRQEIPTAGSKAPDFTLMAQGGEKVRLSDLRGKKVVLGFHPLAFTRICTRQMVDLELARDRMEAAGATALGLSVDPVPAKKAWAQSIGVSKTPLLADFWPHGAVARAYGVWNEEQGASTRATFIVDEEGIVAWRKDYPPGTVPDIEEILAVLEGL